MLRHWAIRCPRNSQQDVVQAGHSQGWESLGCPGDSEWDRAHLQNLTDECATMAAHWTSGLILKIIFALSINETVETYSLLCSYTVVLEQIFY